MGFFTQLGDLWGDGNNYGFGKSWDKLGDAWSKTTSTAKDFASGLWNIATSTATNKQSLWDSFIDLNKTFGSAYLGAGEAGLSLLGGAAELPVVKQLVGTAGFIQNEFVKRPMGTGYLMTGDVGMGKASYFDMDAWRQAYNDTRYVSTGQAATYSFWGSGADSLKKNAVDPRTFQGQEAYQNNKALKYQSGSMDAAVDMFADPTVFGGKALAALKLRYLSTPLRTAADVDKFVDTTKYAKLHDFIKQAPNPEVVRQTVGNGHSGGGTAFALLWDVRNDDDLYHATFNALYGNEDSWNYLVQNAPRIAEATGRVYANQSIADAANAAGQSQKANSVVDALRETESQAFVDAIANGDGAWGAARGSLLGQSAPRLTVTSKWRAGVHNWLTFGPAVFRGGPLYPVFSRARYGMPSATFTRFLDVNDINSVKNFRANVERSPLDRDQVEQYVSQYGRASSPESRARIAASAEDAAFQTLAAKHGFTPEQVNAALPAINQWRTANREVFSTSRRFMSKDAVNLYNKYVAGGRMPEADNTFFLKNDIDDAIARGDQPQDFYHVLDEDGNNVFLPGRFNVDPSRPVLLSQTPDIMPMQDWRSLDTALWWTRQGPIGANAYKLLNAGTGLLDAVNTVWKIAALLRPGQVWRQLSDDVMRRGALYGSSRILMSTSRGVKNAGMNFAARGGLVRDAVLRDRRLRGFDATDVVDADVDDVSPGAVNGYQRQLLGGAYAPSADELMLSTGSDTRLLRSIQATAGMDTFTKAHIRRELKIGDSAANRLLQHMVDRGVAEEAGTVGRSRQYRSKVDPQDLGLLYQPLDYSSYDKALADGVLSVKDYLDRVDFHAERGDLPADLAMIVQGRNDGTLAPKATLGRDYQRQVVDRALRGVGAGAYSLPSWQDSFKDYLIQRHLGKKQGETGLATVVDPTTGLEPIPGKDVTPDKFTLSKGQLVDPSGENIYKYVADNIDDLLKPNNLLHAYVAPNGQFSLSVARHVDVDDAAGPVVKQSGGIRMKFRGGDAAKRVLGADKVVANTPHGQVRVAAAFEGAEGARFMKQASSRGPQDAWADQVSNTEYGRLLNESGAQRDVNPTEPHYQTAWERAVNVQLHNDQAAQQFMAGRTVDDVLNWMRNTADGRAYWGRLGPWQSRAPEQIMAVKALVDTYLPEPNVAAAVHGGDLAGADAHTAASDLRKAALAGKANFRDFDKLFPNKEEMPAVHGSSLDVTVGGPFTNLIKKSVNTTFKIISDLPADKASRFPFFAERYQDHINDIAPYYAAQAGDASLIKADVIDRIQRQARERALADVKKYLYDTGAALDMAKAGRLVVPFSSAIGDSLLKWGVIAREKGVIPPVLNIWKMWTAPDRAGLVQDENGNVKRWNPNTLTYDWYQRVPVKGADGQMTYKETRLDGHEPKQEYIVFQLPVGAKTPSGAVLPTYINKETFNTFLGLPTAGPLVAVPANEFELKNPALADKWFMRKFVLPFGPTSDRYKAVLPSNVRANYNMFTEDDASTRGLAQAVLQTEYTKYALGQRDKPPTMEEVQQSASDLHGLQYLSQIFGVSAQFKSPYQPYVDYYRMLQQTDPEHALSRFYDDMGDEYRMMTASVSRNVAGLPASVEGAKAQKKYADLIAQFPELAPLIVGSEGAGAFSQAVYQAQLEQSLQPGSDQKMRQVLSLQDSVVDAERKYVWVKYGKMMDAIKADMEQRGLKTLTQKRAADLKKIRDGFIEAHKYWTNPQGAQDVSPWFQEFSTTDRAKMTQRLTAMAQIVTDPNSKIGDRDDMRGLYDYLKARTEVRQVMAQRKYANLDSRKAQPLANQWNSYVSDLTEQNLSFAALYNRWLSNDDLTADIIFNPQQQ